MCWTLDSDPATITRLSLACRIQAYMLRLFLSHLGSLAVRRVTRAVGPVWQLTPDCSRQGGREGLLAPRYA